jgi:hypothetical protein
LNKLPASRLWKNHFGTAELRWPARLEPEGNNPCRMLKKAAASESPRRTTEYVEGLSDARTPLADFFSILLEYLT